MSTGSLPTQVSIIMICTIVGNLTLIFALTCKRSRRIKRVNVFLINLAIGDLAVAFFTNTTEIFFLAFGDWALGPAACKISVYTQIVTLASATFLLTAMSIDRYQVNNFPGRKSNEMEELLYSAIMEFCCVLKSPAGEWP